MAHPDYIAAAQQANRQPTVFVEIEESAAESLYYTTQTQFEGSDTLTQIDTDEEPGSAWHKKHDEVPTYHNISFPFDIGTRYIKYTATEDSFITDFIHGVYFADFPSTYPASILGRASLSKDVNFVTGVTVSDPFPLNPSFAPLVFPGDSRIIYGWNNTVLRNYNADVKMLTGEVWYLKTEYSINGTDWFLATHDTTWSTGYGVNNVSHSAEVAQLITSEIDFGEVLTNTPTLSIDDITEGGESITYSYTYSDDDISYTSGGTVVDGDKLTPSRYYKIQADFLTSNGARGKISEIKLTEGLFRWYGTHINEPFAGVLPYLSENSVSSLNQKIKIGKGLSTTGEVSVKFAWVDDSSDLIASGYLKGQDVSIYSGFVGLSTDAYEPVLTGTWYDHDLDEKNRVITVKIRDALKQLEKRKIPEEVVNNTNGSITNRTLTYTTSSLVTVMKNIFDEIGLRDRYIHPDFDTLEAGDYAANKYKVSREITKPLESNKLIDELAVTGSMFLIPLGNGQIKPKPFDINQDHDYELDATQFEISNFKGNISEFFSRFYAYYNPNVTDPTDADDYDNGTALIDATAETKWFPEKGTKQHFDKWKVGRTSAGTALTTPPTALVDWTTLSNQLLTEPLYTMTLKKVPPRWADIEPADVIALNNLTLPVVSNEWDTPTQYNGLSKDISTQATLPTGIAFQSNGNRMYIADINTGTIYQYDLSEPWNVQTASYNSVSKVISTEDISPTGLTFRPDGTKMYMIGVAGGKIYQYTLSTAWDISTASYDSLSLTIGGQDVSPTGLSIKSDGKKIFTVGIEFNSVYQYSLSTAWDISTGSYDSTSFDTSTQTSYPTGMSLDPDGNSMFVVDGVNQEVYQYSMSSGWDLSTASYDDISKDISDQSTAPRDIIFSVDGTKMYIVDADNDTVYQYSVAGEWNIGTRSYTTGDKVIHDGRMWRARKDSTGKNPTSEAEFWQDTGILDNGLTDKKHFFVMGRKFNPNTALIDLDLMEMPPSVLGGFSDGFSSGFNI